MLAADCPRRQARRLRWLCPPWDEQHPDWLRLDRDLPQDHRARLIDRFVDQLDLRPYLYDFCKGFGSASWHPALLLKVALYEQDRKVLSPAQWHRDGAEHTPLMWLTRGARPCRSALYDCRRRLCPELLEQLNGQVLLAAQNEQFCPGRRGSLDGTFTAARGSRHQLLNLGRLDKRLSLLQSAVAGDRAGVPPPRRPRWMARTAGGRHQQQQRYQDARRRLLAKIARHDRQQARRAKSKRRPASRVVVSASEPEAAVGKDKTKVLRPLYDTQLLRDLDSPFLLGYGVFAAATDAGLLPEMLRRTARQAGRLPEELLADAIYASVADLRACRDAGVVLYAALKAGTAARPAGAAEQGSRRQPLPLLPPPPPGRRGYYGKEQFVWDEPSQSYTCPAGQVLERLGRGKEGRVNGGEVAVEKYGTKACQGCPQRPACTRSQYGRKIKRLVEEPLLHELRQRMGSAAGQQLYRLRQQTIELAFADAAEHRGLRRFSGFGLRLAQTQVGLLVLLHNGKALMHCRQAAGVPAA